MSNLYVEFLCYIFRKSTFLCSTNQKKFFIFSNEIFSSSVDSLIVHCSWVLLNSFRFFHNVPDYSMVSQIMQHCFKYFFLTRMFVSNTPPHLQSVNFSNPIIFLSLWKCILPIPFVMIPAILFLLTLYFNLILLALTWSLT